MLTIHVTGPLDLDALAGVLRELADEILDRGAFRAVEAPRVLEWDGEVLGLHALAPWPPAPSAAPDPEDLARHPEVVSARAVLERAREDLTAILARQRSLECAGVNADNPDALAAFVARRAALQEEAVHARRRIASAEEGERIALLNAARGVCA
jgi:hypothetical protein